LGRVSRQIAAEIAATAIAQTAAHFQIGGDRLNPFVSSCSARRNNHPGAGETSSGLCLIKKPTC
jgi:hypothetical protein